MRRYLDLLIIFIISLVIYSCTEIIDPDISKEKVILISPSDNYISSSTNISFVWSEIEFATDYQLQIVSPTFNNPNQWIIDTTITGSKLNLTLFPGTFEWRVRALNASWETTYTYRHLKIEKDTDITQQNILLISPQAYDTTNRSTITFRWEPLLAADLYSFKLSYNGNVVYEKQLTQDSLTININHGEGKYSWMVRGENQYYNTAFFSRELILDTVLPGTPVLAIPINNASLSDSVVNFGWERSGTSISVVEDSLFVCTDSLMINKVISLKTPFTWSQQTLSTGTFFWRVKSVDAAGNQSQYSDKRKLSISVKK